MTKKVRNGTRTWTMNWFGNRQQLIKPTDTSTAESIQSVFDDNGNEVYSLFGPAANQLNDLSEVETAYDSTGQMLDRVENRSNGLLHHSITLMESGQRALVKSESYGTDQVDYDYGDDDQLKYVKHGANITNYGYDQFHRVSGDRNYKACICL